MFVVVGLIAAAVWYFGVREPARPNVILISIDTLRADHVGCYGYERDTTPNLDALAAKGFRFDRAHSTTSWTLPAHMALMTGLPNELHDVRHDSIKLDPARRMLAESFRKAGYATAGFYGGPYLAPEFGFDRGFQRYENCGAPTQEELKKAGLDPTLAERESHRVVTAAKIEDRAEAFLDRLEDGAPFFLFLHHWDVHYDFNDPGGYARRFYPDYRGTLNPSAFMRNPDIAPDMSREDLDWVIAHYDAEIRWVDYHVGRLLRKLDDLGLRENTYVVVTADHGEEFFEHGNKGHRQTLFEESLRVPLIVAGPGIRHDATDQQARLFDVMPTVLDLAGLPAVHECYGVSLAPLLRGEDPPELRDLPLIAELTDIPLEVTEEGDLIPGDRYFQTDAVGLAGHKWIHWRERDFTERRLKGPVLDARELLFDLDADPTEQHDIAGSRPEILERLRELRSGVGSTLARFKGILPRAFATGEEVRRTIPPDLAEQLRQNDYVGAPGGFDEDELLPGATPAGGK